MSIRIENLTDRPVLLCLSSGLNRYLAPFEKTGPFLNTEINQGIRRLAERNILKLLESREKSRRTKSKTVAKRRQPKNKTSAGPAKKTAKTGSKTGQKKK